MKYKNVLLVLTVLGRFFHGSGFFRIGFGFSANPDPDSGKKSSNTGQKRTKHTNKSIIQRSKAVSDIVHLVLEELVLECLLPGVGAGPLKALLVLAIVIRHLSHLHEKEGCFKSCDSVNLKASYPSSWLSLARKHSMA